MEIARTVAAHYEALTGDNPTVRVMPANNKAYGPFLKLLEQVYWAIGIEASAESQAKQVVAERRGSSLSRSGAA